MQRAFFVLILGLVGCSPRVEQVVTRYRLDLASPSADAGERCWQGCNDESRPGARAECIAACPGVEARFGEACSTDRQSSEKELCYTHVFMARKSDENRENLRIVEAIAGGLARGASLRHHESEDHESRKK